MKYWIIWILILFYFNGAAQYVLEEEDIGDVKHGIMGHVGWGFWEDYHRPNSMFVANNGIIGGAAYRYQSKRFLVEIGFLYNRQLSVPIKLGFTTRSKKHPMRVHPFFLGGMNLFFTEKIVSPPDNKILVNISAMVEVGINIPIFKNMHIFIKQKGHLSLMGAFLHPIELQNRNIMMIGMNLSLGYMAQF